MENIRNVLSELNPFTVKISVLTFLTLTFLWDVYLSYRQYLVLQRTTNVPVQLSGVLDQKSLEKSRNYSIDKMKFGIIMGTWEQILTTIIIYFDLTYLLWKMSKNLLSSVTDVYNTEIMTTLVFVLIGSIISEIISLPWSIYSNFVIEERHGFNKYTASFYAVDKIKKLIIGQLIMLPLLAGTVKIIHAGGDYFFLYLWVFCLVISLLLLTIYPDFIAPLFDKFVPLQEGELKSQIDALASSIDFPLTKIYVVEGSKRSSHSNAYLYGFHKNKRIVLFDTLIQNYKSPNASTKDEAQIENESTPKEDAPSVTEQLAKDSDEDEKSKGCSNNEVVAILAHELGHWKMNHTLKNLVIVEVNLLLCFSVFAFLYKLDIIYSAFGFVDEKPLFIGLLIIFQFIFGPYNEILSFLVICLSRKFEYEGMSCSFFLIYM